MRFEIRFSKPGRLMAAIGILPSLSWVEVTEEQIRVRMSWAFDVTAPRDELAAAERHEHSYVSRGAHGWRGRWLVNGSGDRLVWLAFAHVQAGVLGPFRIKVREVIVSLEEPGTLLELLNPSGR